MAIKAYNPGNLKHLMELQAYVDGGDGEGGRVQEFITVDTVHYAIEEIQTGTRGLEQKIIAGAVREKPYFMLTRRYREGITPRMRVVWSSPLWPTGQRVFEVVAKPQIKDERRRYINLPVMEITQADPIPFSGVSR